MHYNEVLQFWYDDISVANWFQKNDVFDLKMIEKFIVIHSQAVISELSVWRNDPLGRLAEIILIDQFSRNIYRGEAKAYAHDSLALALAQEAISKNIQSDFTPIQKQFLYLPFMHSESRIIHEVALSLFSETGLESSLKYELVHKEIIDKFGRYPERNKILGRQNSPEEEQYLNRNKNGQSNGKYQHRPFL